MVMILEDFDDLWETAALEAECLEQHLIDSCAADHGKMAEIVIVGFK